MIVKQRGFIFLMTLIITLVISILVLSFMQQLLLYYKVASREEERQRHFYQLETIAKSLLIEPIGNSSCVLHQDLPNQSIDKLLHQQGCLLNNEFGVFRYLIEDLGSFPCLLVVKQGKKYGTMHRRISIAQWDEGEVSSLIQLRYIAIGPPATCLLNERIVPLGVSSWRYFDSGWKL